MKYLLLLVLLSSCSCVTLPQSETTYAIVQCEKQECRQLPIKFVDKNECVIITTALIDSPEKMLTCVQVPKGGLL